MAPSSSPTRKGAIPNAPKASRDRASRTRATRVAPPALRKGTGRTSIKTIQTVAKRQTNRRTPRTRSPPATAPGNRTPKVRKGATSPAAESRGPDKAPIRPAPAAPVRTRPPTKARAKPKARARARIQPSPAAKSNPTNRPVKQETRPAMAQVCLTNRPPTAHDRASLATSRKVAMARMGPAAIAPANCPTASPRTEARSTATRPTWTSPASNSISRSTV